MSAGVRCCEGRTHAQAVVSDGSREVWVVECSDCGRVLSEVEAPREEIYAHL